MVRRSITKRLFRALVETIRSRLATVRYALEEKYYDWHHNRDIHGLAISDLLKILALPLDLVDLETAIAVDGLLRQNVPGSKSGSSAYHHHMMGSSSTTTTTDIPLSSNKEQSVADATATAAPILTTNTTASSSSSSGSSGVLWGDEDITLTTTATQTTADAATDPLSQLLVQLEQPVKSLPTIFTTPAGIPVALVMFMLLLRALWYFRQHHSQSSQQQQQEQEQFETSSKGSRRSQRQQYHGNGNHSQSSMTTENHNNNSNKNGNNMSSTSVASSSDNNLNARIAAAAEEKAKELRLKLEREAQTRQAIAAENRALQQALEAHKASVDKFQSELQSRNQRLSHFEQEQDAVRQDLTGQIEVLKRELAERQSQEQGTLQSKEQLCNDLIAKIQTLNKDLENHERLWKGVSQKAQQKEQESAAKVASLQESLRQEQVKRRKELELKETEAAELNAKLRTLASEESQKQRQAVDQFNATRQATEATLQQRLAEEQVHTSNLTNKLQVFSSELASRQERVTSLNQKMQDFERLSAKELQQLQEELQAQMRQRAKLHDTAVEMTRLLQEKRDQCLTLTTQLDSSKAELKALDNRVQTLAKEVTKREAVAAARMDALQTQLDGERKQVEDCRRTVETTNEELRKTQEGFVQLTARMDLFLKELQFRDEQVASLESKMADKEDLATSEIKILRGQLQVHQERRDEWNRTTESLQQLLQDKRAQIVGLTTRAELFQRELQKRQEVVAALEAKVQERREAEAIKMEPYRKELQRLQDERDVWKGKTQEIDRLLQQKKGQIQGLKTRLMLFEQEVAKRDERVAILKNSFLDKKHQAMQEVAPAREKLESLREQRDDWAGKTNDIDRLLNEKRGQCIGLTTRVHLFEQELQTKNRVVALLETKLADKEEAGEAAIASLKKRLDEQTKGRDEWLISTEKVRQLLADKKKESAELTLVLKELVGGLQDYQQRRASLDPKIKEIQGYRAEKRGQLEKELQAHEKHCENWRETTNAMIQSLRDTESSIIGLETRAMLFEKELEQRRETVATLEKEYQRMLEKSSSKIKQLREEIDGKKEEHENGVELTLQLNKELKDIKRQCIGLTTRSKLFVQELEKRQDLVNNQEAKINEMEREASIRLQEMRNALSGQTKERDEWKQKTAEIEQVLQQTEREIVGLGTRLELFMSQVMTHEENVSRAEKNLSIRRAGAVNPSFVKELDAAKEKRDEWTLKALEIEGLLKTKKAQIPGLRTRKTLFRKELSRRDEQVAVLEATIAEKKKLFASRVTPLKNALKGYLQQRDEWKANSEKIDVLLSEKEEQCLPLAGKLEECIDLVTKCKEIIDSRELELREEENFSSDKISGFKRRLEDQQRELRQWEESTVKVQGLLREKKQGTHGLKTRLKVFNSELRKREDAVMSVKAKITENDMLLAEEVDSIIAQIDTEHGERDRIIETTLAKNQALKTIEDTCRAMSIRCKLFEDELRLREDQVTQLEAKLREKEYDYSAQIKTLKNELASKRSDRDNWRASTQSIAKLLNDTKGECVGLDTRLQLFSIEKTKYDKQVAELEARIDSKEIESAEQIAPLEGKLEEEQDDRNNWDQKTSELNDKLQETKREVVGLTTRSKLFKQELKQKEKGVNLLGAKIKKDDDDFAERMEPLMKQYDAHREERDTWEKSTLNVKRLLEQTKNECASIPTRLDLFLREQKTREDAVAELDSKIKNTEDLVAIQLGFLLNELQLQQKQRGKWKKVTLEMHRLLKEKKEQVASLTSKLESAKKDLRERQELVTRLETSVRDGRDMAAQQLNTLKNEVKHQREQRDKLSASCAELSRRLEEAEELCKDLSQKQEEAKSQAERCTEVIEKMESKVNEKKKIDAAQIDSIKEQLKVHMEQQSEWQENTNQMKQRLKEKQDLCVSFKTKMAMLKKLENGEVRSSLAAESNGSSAISKPNQNGLSSHLDKLSMPNGKKSKAEQDLTAKMDSLEKELRSSDNQKSNLNSKLEVLTSELLSL